MASYSFLDQILTFPDGSSFQRLEPPITDFRQCHGVTPPERRILFRCRRISPEESSPSNPSNGNISEDNNEEEQAEYILKIKVQIPDDPSAAPSSPTPPSTTSPPQPSTATTHELDALTIFRDSHIVSAPHLITFSHSPQNATGPLPQKGYISSTVMSKLSGKSLFELGYWSLASEEREEIQRGFLEALRSVRELGIEPGDKGLRNVMWDRESKKCGLVDFEMWDPYTEKEQPDPKDGSTKLPEKDKEAEGSLTELRKWGLVSRPPAKNWWAEFGIVTC